MEYYVESWEGMLQVSTHPITHYVESFCFNISLYVKHNTHFENLISDD